jgi:hypothetical protein
MNYNTMATAATIARIAGIDPPRQAVGENPAVTAKAASVFNGRKADRVVLYNPDGVANWLFRKYTRLFEPALIRSSLQLPVHAVMPTSTPVCFASMYTGASPDIHGIKEHVKPVVKTDTLFDAYIRAGKKPAIVSTGTNSMSMIFRERVMDYFIFPTPEECNEKAAELIRRDEHDLIVLYNGNFDYTVHRRGPEAEASLAILRKNVEVYAGIHDHIVKEWRVYNTLTAFLPDHGCHLYSKEEIKGEKIAGHYTDRPEDMEVIHIYGFIPAAK